MGSDLPPNLRPDAFVGVAEDYLRFRPPYPAALVASLVAAAPCGPGACAIDLACGPGRLTFDLAPHVDEVWAQDQEPQMIALATAEAAARGISNVRWRVGRAETFEAPAGAFALVTVADAFHRLDQPRILAAAWRWLQPGGVFATLGGPAFLEGETPWRQVLAKAVADWIAPTAAPAPTHDDFVARLRRLHEDAGFADFETRQFDVEREWTLEQLLGFLRSTSVLSRHALGERHAAFEAALTQAMLAHDASGRYRELARFGCTMGRKP